MKPEQIKKFIQALGVNNAGYGGGTWVTSSCPLAPFTHKNGKDSRPSFGVTVEPGGGSHFNCFTCLSGSLESLIGTLEMYVQKQPELGPLYDFKLARAYLESDDLQVEALEDYQEFQTSPYAEFQEWPQWYIESFGPWWSNPEAVTYLQNRSVPADLADQFDLRYDSQAQRLVAPYRNVWGKLSGARGRAVGPYGMKHFDYTWNKVNNAALVWYNEPVLQHSRPVIVVEGQFDVLRMVQVYPTVVGNLTSKISLEKMKKLEMCESVLFMLDNDETGKMHTPKYVQHLQSKGVDVGVVEYPEEYKDPDSMPLSVVKTVLDGLL